jgi:hypothetical protein
MAEFESWNQYSEFSYFVRRKSRHILDAKNQEFLNAVLETSQKRRASIKKGTVLWRAQLGHAWRPETLCDDSGNVIESFDVEDPLPPERMLPLGDRAFEGRVNPKGIPCLYFSTDKDTAMAETRPWIGSCVSVAQFVMLRELSVVDCSSDDEWMPWPGSHPEPENYVWGAINRALSYPVTRSDDVAEYAPTHVLAEAFRSAGFDGIVYGSKLGSGKTVAVFDLSSAELANCHLYRVEAVNLKFGMAANPYYVEKYCNAEKQSVDAKRDGGV